MKVSAAFALIAVFSVIPLRAGNIVLNPGFESGDFASWTVSRAAEDVTDLVVSSPGNSGSFSAGFGATGVGAYDSISQDLATVNGQSYSLGFFLQSQFESSGDDLVPGQIATRSTATLDPVGDFQVFWDGALLLDVPDGSQTTIGFEQFSFNVRGTGTDTLLFRGYNLPSFYRLDDVSVDTAATPEPATFVAMGFGFAAILAARRIHRNN